MTRQRFGGSLVVAGSAGFGLAELFALIGASLTQGTAIVDIPSVLAFGSLALLGLGAAILASGRPALRTVGPFRAGLALVGVGLLGLALLWAWTTINPLPGDPLSSPIIFLYFGCVAAAFVGQIVVAIALVRETGFSRLVGALFVGGIVVTLVSLPLRQGDVLLGIAVVVAGWAALGILLSRRANARPLPS